MVLSGCDAVAGWSRSRRPTPGNDPVGGRTRRRSLTPAMRARRRRRRVKTPCQMVEQPASLSLIVPLAMRRVRAHRLKPAMIKPRLASRRCRLHRPARLPCCALSLICCLYFPVLLLLEQYFVKFAQLHPLGVYSNYIDCRPIEGLMCKYNHACVCLLFMFAFILSAFSFAAFP